MSVTYIINPVSGDKYATVFANTGLNKKLGTLSKGTTITILSTGSNYYKIKYNGGSSSSTPESGTVKANGGLKTRTGPGTSYAYVGAFNNGAKLTIHDSSNGWYKVSGTSGWGKLNNVWVSKQYVIETSTQGYGYLSKTDVKAQTTNDGSSSSNQSSANLALNANYQRNYSTIYNDSYSGDSSKRYLGTDDYYKKLMSKLNYCFGTPPKYNMDIDIQYVSDVGLGRVMGQTYYSNPTILSICPGKVKMFPQLFNKKARDNAFNTIYEAARGAGDGSVVQKILGDKNSDILNGPLYEFSQDTQDYAKRLNLLCRTCAILLGIGDDKMPYTSTPLRSFDYAYWSIRKKYSPSTGKQQNVFTDFWAGGIQAAANAVGDENYIHFLVSNENTSISEGVTTDVEASFLENIVSSTNSIANQLSYFSGVGFNNQMDAKANIDNALNGIIGESGWTKLVDNVLSGGKLKIPKIVGDTNFSQSISCSLKFLSPYGNPKAVFLWCIVPVCHLYALALPKQLSDSMYSYPYIIKVFQKGWFNSNLAVISSINLVRGGNDDTSWSSAGLATEWTVNFEITPLYSQLTMPSTDHPLLFIKNDGLIDYLGNLCGFDLKANNLNVKAKLLTSFIKNKFTDIPNDIQRWVSDGISDSISKVFQF